MDSLVLAIVLVIASTVGLLAYDAGKRSVADDCESFGKAKVNRVMYACSLQK